MFRVPWRCPTPCRMVMFECTPFYYPFGNTEAQDLFKIWNPASSDHAGITKVLLLGCGDLRNALTTATGERGNRCLEIHLNDNNPSIIARNVLILSIITSEDFNLEGDKDFKFLWDVWYNALWSKPTATRFTEIVRNLVGGILPSNVNIPREEDRAILTEVWLRWLAMFDSNREMSAKFIEEVTTLRRSFIVCGWIKTTEAHKLYGPNDATSLREATHCLASSVESTLYEGVVPDVETIRKIRQELMYYFEHGYCYVGKQNSRTKNTSVNPTLLDPLTKKWYVHYTLNPFEGFFNLFKQNIAQMGAQTFKNEQAILLTNSQAILRKAIETYRKECQKTVKFKIHLSDALDFCLIGTTETFDVIDSSNLSDNIGLANILVAARGRLSNKPDSILITQTMQWLSLTATVVHYVQEALGAPLSMIPTVYGLKLVSSVELGSEKSRILPMPASLIWRRCLDYENVALTPSSAVKKCFENILSIGLRQSESGDCGLVAYTLLTFHLIASSLSQRFGQSPNDNSLSSLLTSANALPDNYRLQFRTFDFWAKGRRLSKFTSVMAGQQITPAAYESFQNSHGNLLTQSTPVLQLLLIPKSLAPNIDSVIASGLVFTSFTQPDVHVIDIFTFRFVRKKDDPESLEAVHVTFVLPEETTVELTHVAIMFDIRAALPLNMRVRPIRLLAPFAIPMFYLGDIKCLNKEPFNEPYPIQVERTRQVQQSSGAQLTMTECLESDDKYVIKFERGNKKQKQLFHFDTNQEPPCESAHLLKISWKNATQFFQFPHAFMADEITSTTDVTNDTLKVTLRKAVHEPWPFQFKNTTKKIDTDCLKLWKETKQTSLSVHLSTQFKLDEFLAIASSGGLVRATPLSEVRQLIRLVFSSSFQNAANRYFALKAGWTECEPVLYLRAHWPIRVGPNGEPLLAVTAFNHQQAQQVAECARMDVDKSIVDFARIMLNDSNRQICHLTMPTPEGVQLFRYLLRLNSTKIEANAWQKSNLPKREKNDPLVMFPTYLSPLYGDGDGNFKLKRDGSWAFASNRLILDDGLTQPARSSCCVTCGKQRSDLKQCSRCKSANYCGAECQKTDWPRHKPHCKAFT